MMYKIQLSASQATRLGAVSCNWLSEPCVRMTKAECDKNFNAIINDSIHCIKRGIKSYLFTQEQIVELKNRMLKIETKMTYIVKEMEDRYLIIPRRKRGMK
jgi:hypothetical protein